MRCRARGGGRGHPPGERDDADRRRAEQRELPLRDDMRELDPRRSARAGSHRAVVGFGGAVVTTGAGPAAGEADGAL
jgi:hypothetical protein